MHLSYVNALHRLISQFYYCQQLHQILRNQVHSRLPFIEQLIVYTPLKKSVSILKIQQRTLHFTFDTNWHNRMILYIYIYVYLYMCIVTKSPEGTKWNRYKCIALIYSTWWLSSTLSISNCLYLLTLYKNKIDYQLDKIILTNTNCKRENKKVKVVFPMTF